LAFFKGKALQIFLGIHRIYSQEVPLPFSGDWIPILYIWVFPTLGVPQNGWFIMENSLKMDDLGGKPTIFGNIHIYHMVINPMIERIKWIKLTSTIPSCSDLLYLAETINNQFIEILWKAHKTCRESSGQKTL